MLGREHRLVVYHLLHVGHDVVGVLRSRHLGLLAPVVYPLVGPGPWAGHLGTAGLGAELGDGPVDEVDVLEKADS